MLLHTKLRQVGTNKSAHVLADFPKTGKVPQALPLSQLGVVNLVHLTEHCRPQNLHWIKLCIVTMLVCAWGGVGGWRGTSVCVCVGVHTLNRHYGQDCERSAFD